jgi:hypothetical protein
MSRQEDNIKMELRETRFGGVDWIHVVLVQVPQERSV